MDLEEYKQQFNEDSSPGWEALNVRLEEVYGTQEPKHWGTILSYALGGPDPLDGLSAYMCDTSDVDHLHFVTFGYSSLYYDEESVGAEYSKFGFEMTFRLASQLPPEEEPNWVLNLLQNLARYVFETGNWFGNYHWIRSNGPIRGDYETDIVGYAFLNDPTLDPAFTPHGRVDFIQAFGLVQSELDDLKNKTRTCEQIVEEHRITNPLLITDLDRKDLKA